MILGVFICINEYRNEKYWYFAKALIFRDCPLGLSSKEEKLYASICMCAWVHAPPRSQVSHFIKPLFTSQIMTTFWMKMPPKCDYFLNAFCRLASLAGDAVNVTPSFHSISSKQIILLLYIFPSHWEESQQPCSSQLFVSSCMLARMEI